LTARCVTVRTLDIHATSDSKVYDGTTDSDETPTFDGLQTGDSLTDLAQAFQSKNVLGTDGMGRSESRGALRRHFEVDAECITLAALYQLKKLGKCDGQCVANAVKDLGIDPAKQSALYA
jgi:pyruvate dehydrogenase complex dehydrogenase (E1) component